MNDSTFCASQIEQASIKNQYESLLLYNPAISQDFQRIDGSQTRYQPSNSKEQESNKQPQHSQQNILSGEIQNTFLQLKQDLKQDQMKKSEKEFSYQYQKPQKQQISNESLKNAPNLSQKINFPFTFAQKQPSLSSKSNQSQSYNYCRSLNLDKDIKLHNNNLKQILQQFIKDKDQQYLDTHCQASFTKKTYNFDNNIVKNAENLQLQKKLFKSNNQQVVKTQNLLGQAYFYSGQFTEAFNIFQRVKQIYEIEEKQKDQIYFRNNNDIGAIHSVNGDQNLALQCYLTCAKQWKERLNVNHELYSIFLGNVSTIYINRKLFNQAEKLLIQCIQIEQSLPVPNHSNFALSYLSLLQINIQLNRIQQAQKAMQKAVKHCDHIQQDNHPTLIRFYIRKARLRCEQDRNIQAAQTILKAQNIIKEIYQKKDNHSIKIQHQVQIGKVYLKMKDYMQSENYFQGCLNLTKERVGEDHNIYKNLAKEIKEARQAKN